MDDEIAALAHGERLAEAGALASARGDHKSAADLFERACDWSRAAIEAAKAGDAGRALLLAVQGRDEEIGESAIAELSGDPTRAEAAAASLERKGEHAWAARLYEAAGRARSAARAWEHAGDAERAARLHEQVGEPAEAARALEAHLRREPDAWKLHVSLGALLLRYGKAEAAVRALQRVPRGSEERKPALAHLVRALARLGFAQAAAEASRELAELGGIEEEAAASQAAPAKARLFGRYEVVREIASTPSARVLACVDVVRGERVALKVFAGYDARGTGRDALARFEREVRALSALAHPSVVHLHEYLPEGPAIVMDFMTGGTLEAMLAKEALAPARAVEIASAVLSALGEAHRLGILHRDIKPGNVLFDEAGVARLGDFGVAHLSDVSTTATAGVIGTLAYMSPEQREGRPATIKSDLYGVGVMLREMITGEKPSPSESPRVLPSAAHRDLDARHDAVVLKMTAASPDDRPIDAFDARRELLSIAWPSTFQPAAPRPAPERKSSVRPQAARIAMEWGGRVVDTWIGRPIERTPLTARALARAAAFARAGHVALQTVLRVDRDDDAIWLEPPRGTPLDRKLTADEKRVLHDALDALHAHGVAHGCVCEAHVVVADGEITLRFEAEAGPTATADLDRLALARL